MVPAFALFINQQVYNSFSFLLFSLSVVYLVNTRKVYYFYKDIMYELFSNNKLTTINDLFSLGFIYLYWWSFLEIPLIDYDMQIVAKIFYNDMNGLLIVIAL